MFKPNDLAFRESYTYNRNHRKIRIDLPVLILRVEAGGYRVRYESDHEAVEPRDALIPMTHDAEDWARPILGFVDIYGKRGYHFAKRDVSYVAEADRA